MHSSMNTVGKQTFLRIAADYIESLGGRDLRVCVFGEKVAEPVDHPLIRPSVNAAAATCMLANVCKHHVTKSPYEMGRLAQDLAGDLGATMPSEADLKRPQIGGLLQEHVRGQADAPTEACTGGQHVSGPNEVPTHFAQHGRTPMAVDQS